MVFFYSSIFITAATGFVASSEPRLTGFEDAIWSSRLTVGWILVCGLAGALLPTIGWDSRPRPEVWGFLSGLLIAPALLPRMELVEHSLIPILLLSVTMPVMASFVEFRPEFSVLRRILELSLIIGGHIIVLFLTVTGVFPLTLIVLLMLLPICWVHHQSSISSPDEEE